MVYSSSSTSMELVFKLSDNTYSCPISITERLPAGGSVQQFFLDQWKPQLLQLLSCSSSQDAKVEITVHRMGSDKMAGDEQRRMLAAAQATQAGRVTLGARIELLAQHHSFNPNTTS